MTFPTHQVENKLSCRICGSTEGHQYFRPREMMFGLQTRFDYFQCSNCHCLQIGQFPEDMSAYYPESYYSFGKYDGKKFKGWKGGLKRFQYRNSVMGNRLFKSLFGIKEYRVFDGLTVNYSTRILDVGCGNGRNFLYPLAEVGFTHVVGCDPFLNETIVYENGLRIEKTDVFGMEGKWDVITYHHAFEHLPNPKENLARVRDLLNDAGYCILRIPTVSSFAWEHYGEDWVQLDAPRHFFLHSRESIQLLAEAAGMELAKVVYDSTHFQFMGSEKYLKNIPLSAKKEKGLWASLRRKWDKWRYQRKADRLNKANRGDQAAFILRKT